MARGLWNTLEALAEAQPPAAVLAEWRRLAGADFETLGPFLSPTSRRAADYPCLAELPCGCRHELVPLADDRWVARCECEMSGCQVASLTTNDLWIHELDALRFADTVGGALGFEATPAASPVTTAPKVWPAGTHAETRSPVYLFLCPNREQMLANLQGLAGNCGEPFIVLASTAQVRSELVGNFLQRERCAFIPLASCLTPNGGGFRVTNSIRSILDRFAAGLAAAGKAAVAQRPAAKKSSGHRGRLRYENDFADIWLGEERYDLRERNKARLCIEYLFEKGAFAKTSACHFERQIDPHVRKHSKLEPLPDYAETKLHHYFNPSTGKFAQLGRDLIKSAGRGSGRYFLNVE